MQYISEKFLTDATFIHRFLIREYLRDPLDFSWMLNANIKLN